MQVQQDALSRTAPKFVAKLDRQVIVAYGVNLDGITKEALDVMEEMLEQLAEQLLKKL